MEKTTEHQSSSSQFVSWFRQAAPYIHAHRGKTFVICFGGEAVDDPAFAGLVHDCALLNSLGIRLIVVHGARPQIARRLDEAGLELSYAQGLRITDATSLPLVKQAVGQVRIDIESMFSMGLANSPMHGAQLRIASGNYVTARPLGIRDGVDFCFTGEVRKVDNEAIRARLNDGQIVLISPLGYSPTGEVFNLGAEDVAVVTAASLQADKLLMLGENGELKDASGKMFRQLDLNEARKALETPLAESTARLLEQSLRACERGVRRVHIISRQLDGSPLLECFTRDGVGAMITSERYDDIRAATIDDIGGLIEVIAPLEAEGSLVRRSRELLEMEIGQFTVLERDGSIIGCAALYPYPKESLGEIACVAVRDEYRNTGRADRLLKHIENNARVDGLKGLFVLSTHTSHWFQERGFHPTVLESLPMGKQQMYNWQRKSKVFSKKLTS